MTDLAEGGRPHNTYVSQHMLWPGTDRPTGTHRSQRLADCPAASATQRLPPTSPPFPASLLERAVTFPQRFHFFLLSTQQHVPPSKDRNAPCLHPQLTFLHTDHN